jgi:hypothetical protein
MKGISRPALYWLCAVVLALLFCWLLSAALDAPPPSFTEF